MTAKQVQIRRDSATSLNSSTPANAELAFDTTNKRLRIGDGTTLGGIIHAKAADLITQPFNTATAGGTANALTITALLPPVSYAAYQRFVFKASLTNTGSATVNVNSLGVKTIKKKTPTGLADLEAGDIYQDGVYAIVYDGTYFQLESSGGGGVTTQAYELLASATASSSASLDFTTGFTSDYAMIFFVLVNVKVATNTAVLGLRISTDGGSTYLATGYDCNFLTRNSTSGGYNTSTALNFLNLTGNIASAAAGDHYMNVSMSSPSVTGLKKFLIQGFAGDGATTYVTGHGYRSATTAAINAVRFMASAGNLTSGSIYMYGLRNS